jgi:uncharacterized phage protein (TIGR02218 family)
MVPSAIRRSVALEDDGGDIAGIISHEAIRQDDLRSGRFDGAAITIGVVDWETLRHRALYWGTIEGVVEEVGAFTAQLRSTKAMLDTDPVPRTSPTCRARFCGPGCALSAARFLSKHTVAEVDFDRRAILVAGIDPALYRFGELRWLDGPATGQRSRIRSVAEGWLWLDSPLDPALEAGLPVLLREGCDHRLETCGSRFANAVNFQGEPFLPGNDLLVRTPRMS